ncbi:hypothetical protein OV203_11475 [Nannocystis sp. ILAH1]|uniref:hypothetical protein n=1 Tax=unclassified Nannocystis TaxID=2627009 RepID=UPI00226D8492|nr:MULTISPECIES: hypothetical protein [unclassified Nannocystis]MCY0987749.1 hypothetical protein [Nannocystis sp. ILAH1]MCY1070450.1 hypothetical protein [Nannocystis sp. RBIL2]
MLGLDIVVDGDELVLTPATAERSPSWSSGQVKRSETFNVRAGAPEPGGLFCPAIFGDEPGRTGHVELAAPVVPRPARPLLAALLGASETELAELAISGPGELVARVERAEAEGRTIQGWRPRQLVWWSVPVIAPLLRARSPEEVLQREEDGGFSSLTLHEPYRRIVNRAGRLRKLYEIGAPQVMIDHELQSLSATIDQLLDNLDHAEPYAYEGGTPLMDAVSLFSAALSPELVALSERYVGGWLARAARIASEEVYAGRRLAALWQLAGERPREPLGPELLRWSTEAPADEPGGLRSRYEAALNDTSDGALAVALALVGDVGIAEPASALHVDALLLLVRRALEDAEIDQALVAARAAEALAEALGDRSRGLSATRHRGAALLRAGRVQEALAALEPALSVRGPLFGGRGSFREAWPEKGRAAALAEAAMVAGWAAATTPEWVRALGGLAERATEDDAPAVLWARFEAALAGMIEASPEPADDLEVVLEQARERGLSRTAAAAAQALAASTRDAEAED